MLSSCRSLLVPPNFPPACTPVNYLTPERPHPASKIMSWRRFYSKGTPRRYGVLKHSLSGKVALVTGGGHGIGAAIARTLAGLGATTVICGRKRDRLEQTAR